MNSNILITFDLANLSADMSCTLRLCVNHIDENGNNLADWYEGSFKTGSMSSVLDALESFEVEYKKWGACCSYGEIPFRESKKLSVQSNQPHGYSTDQVESLRKSCILKFEKITLELIKWLNSTVNADHISGLIRSEVRKRNLVGNNLPVRLAFQTKVNKLHDLHWEGCIDSELFVKLKNLQKFDLADSSINTMLSSRVVQAERIRWSYPLKVLVIVGDNDGLETDSDLKSIEEYLGFKPEIHDHPSIEKLTELLLDENWDVIIYLGHSSTHPNGNDGEIIVNASKNKASLSVDDLSNAFINSIDKGLGVLIFISCDGNGLVRKLYEVLEREQKRLPYVIIMRRGIGDSIANAFVKRFAKRFFEEGYSIEESVTKSNADMKVYQGQFPGADSLATLWGDNRSASLHVPQKLTKTLTMNPPEVITGTPLNPLQRFWRWLLESVDLPHFWRK